MSIIANSQPVRPLPLGVSFAASVDGVSVYRTRNGWVIEPGVCAQLWASVQAEVPTGDSGRVLHGSLPGAGYTGPFTQAQLNAYHRRVERFLSAARRAKRVAKVSA